MARIITVTLEVPDDLEPGAFSDDIRQILRDAIGEFAAGRKPVKDYVRKRYAPPGAAPINLVYGEPGSAVFNAKVAQVARRVFIAENIRVVNLRRGLEDHSGRDTDPPPDHTMSSSPEHPRGCPCPRCA